ncbi:MAG: pilus assembly protein PilM [Planctomycetia bacterium]|nr:pilus assembly protein PilM [Planctomycetia bacterium]
MIRSNAVWGIDIGNCSLKAMRCYTDDSDPSGLIVDAVDYIEYPMILTQPEANPDELIRDALQLFLSRNKIKGDKIAISIAGQNGLVRFIKLPPIEPKKIPDIVKYEAKQQIPFDLNDVIWGYQRLGQQSGEMGFLEVEIGLFAMKRDQVFHILEPYENADIPVDIVQLGPLALYNYLMADEMRDLPSMEDYDPENPPPYVVALSMGTDATDLILTNGFRVWQRNLPIGGNNFTKALMKELKLTFAKADHLKRNLATSQDKVAVLKAMQPVFNSLQNEIQRSLGYYSSLDPNAEYERVIALGNGMKLTGLTKYLSKNLGVEVRLGSSFAGLDTSNLADAPSLAENMPTFGICYGLCLQALKRSAVRTNLLPGEIRTARIINSKKPWMIAATALLMLGATVNYWAHVNIQASVDKNAWRGAESAAESLSGQASSEESKAKEVDSALEEVDVIGKTLIGNVEKRLLWIELLKGINSCLPAEEKSIDPNAVPTAESIRNRRELHIVNIEAQQIDDNAAQQWMEEMIRRKWIALPKRVREAAAASAEEGAAPDVSELALRALEPAPIPGLEPTEEAAEAAPASDDTEGEEGSGKTRWLISVTGYHYHNGLGLDSVGAQFVRETFIRNMMNPDKKFLIPRAVELSVVENGDSAEDAEVEYDEYGEPIESSVASEPAPAGEISDNESVAAEEEVSMVDLGVRYPVLIRPTRPRKSVEKNPYLQQDAALASRGGVAMEQVQVETPETDENGEDSTEVNSDEIAVERFDFEVHFIWEPRLPTERAQIRQAVLEAQRLAEEQAAAEAEAAEGELSDEEMDAESE